MVETSNGVRRQEGGQSAFSGIGSEERKRHSDPFLERMGVAQAPVARLELSAANRTHASSIAMLRLRANAVGCELRME